MLPMRHLITILLLLIFSASGIVAQDATEVPPGVTIHVVQRGETLFRIAQQYGLEVSVIARLNGLANPSNIQVGQRLLVPLSSTAVTPPQMHVVQPGETLQSISRLYNLSLEEIAAANNIANVNAIYVGQVLLLQLPNGTPLEAASPPEAAPEQPELPAANSFDEPQSVIHTVLRGETLFRIATQYGVTVNAIVQANNIEDPSLIFPGQQIIIPGVRPPQIAAELPPPLISLQVMPLAFIEGQTGMFRALTSAPAQLSGSFLGRGLNFATEADGTRHTALVGIPVGTVAGLYTVEIVVTDSAGRQSPVSANLQVVSGGYVQETLDLLEDRTNLLDPAVEDAELNLLKAVTAPFTLARMYAGPMGLPAAATITSPFGVSRSYNGGEFSRVHTGTDFGGVPGTPILAPAPGRVVLADTLNIRGVATMIDHGWGVYSGYWHQTERYVGLGDTVTTGQVIGTIGSTGRVSGPHLHWEIWVNGVPVDPMQWVILDFS